MQAPYSPVYPPAPPPPAGPNSRYSPGQPLYQGGGGLAPPISGAHAAGAPGYAHPGNALSPYRPASGAPPPTGSAGPRPYSTGPPLSSGTPGLNQQPPPSSVYPPTPYQTQGRSRARKRLVICCDGTWLDADNGMMHGNTQLPSNVTRIGRAIKSESSDGISQVVFYQSGVGTEGGAISRVVGGATAEGLSSNIREAYSFICHNWSPGDEIFLVGFSRGAFTARSIGGLISAIGLLTKEGIKDLGVIFKDVEHQRDPHYDSRYPDLPFPNKPPASNPKYAAELQRRGLSRTQIPIKAIAVWDTVGSLGIPRVPWLERFGLQNRSVKEYTFYDTSLSPNIENAFQALALDEQRSSFVPTLWEQPRSTAQKTLLRQVWFPGVHSNVGGGYPDMELANITLAWMIAQLEAMLEFSPSYLREQFALSQSYYQDTDQEPRPWSFGKIYRSLTGLYTLAGRATRTPGTYVRRDPDTGAPTKSKLRDTHEYVHPSVRSRVELGGPGVEDKGEYECKALEGYRLRVTGAPTGGAEPPAKWESKGKSRRGGGRRELLESPLFETEIRLLSGSPWVQNYLLGGGKEGRSSGGMGGGGGRPSAGDGRPNVGNGRPSGGYDGGAGGGRRRDKERRDNRGDRRDRPHRDRDRDRDRGMDQRERSRSRASRMSKMSEDSEDL